MRYTLAAIVAVLLLATSPRRVPAQAYGIPDRGEPGDAMIQAYLLREADRVHARFLEGISTAAAWQSARKRYRDEYLYMLGLSPFPARTPLKVEVTATLEKPGFIVEMLHYQSRPGLYVTANLYRPSKAPRGARLPAILYVCGHSYCGRNGNKTAYQSHGIWFARHGYICLVLDTLQLGEIAGVHHGTYREGRWWWNSRGYTPAGVECFNGIRGIDYLLSRPDVDPHRIGVTGISGGGAATFWIAAADERVCAAAAVSGMADLPSYVANRVINGHCDCMFLINTFRWPWTRIAALVAPRPLLFLNSDRDSIFPMDANERVIARLERVYALSGAGDRVDAVVSLGGHAYREDLRKAAFRFFNSWLKNAPGPVTDSEVDLVVGKGKKAHYPIPPELLRVFPRDSDLPTDQINTTVDALFVPVARPEAPARGGFDTWKKTLLTALRRVSFRALPLRVPPARQVPAEDRQQARSPPPENLAGPFLWLETEPGIRIPLQRERGDAAAQRTVLRVEPAAPPPSARTAPTASPRRPGPAAGFLQPGDALFAVYPRGVGPTHWTRKNPPNYVERAHVILGTTVDTGRVRDVVAAARYLKARAPATRIWVAGRGPAGVIASCAALLEGAIDGVLAVDPPSSLGDPAAPRFLNVLRVCDIGDIFGMLAPRPLHLRGAPAPLAARAEAAYAACGAREALKLQESSP